ncbi:tripartite motif-containing protein 10-like [Elgaria multicarinata webbii]|uniref:tripartite motif-containing protein 10-like n=1 Tax=Elgaria multicarinata webbii TaxID=159646 RepID=UPI002FCD42DC
MASAPARTDVEEEAKCPICMSYLMDPVTLDCGHNFCRNCITCYREAWDQIGDLECPLCRVPIPRENLRPNWQLRNLIEKIMLLLNPGKETLCAKHKKKLQLFCKEEEELVCLVCRCTPEHRTHTVVTVEEASQEYKGRISDCLQLLKEQREEISVSISNAEKKSQDLLNQTKTEKQKAAATLRELRRFLETEENLLMAQIQEMEKEIVRNRDEHTARCSEELSSLDSLIQEIEEKCQQVASKLLEDIKGTLQRYKKEKRENPVAFPPATKRKIAEFCDINPFLEGAVKEFKETWACGYQLQKECVILDENTAHTKLILSHDRKSVRVGDSPQVLPEDFSRFDHWQCVLGCKGFNSGRHYWEVLVGNQEKWAVGVARSSVARKGHFTFGPTEGFWAVGKWDSQYWALDYPERLRLSPDRELKRICVSLNYLGGRVAFFDADTAELLFEFCSALFYGEKLHPLIWVWGTAYLRLCS